jgi:5-oxoprolinase (ATP-hydrolysing) subunit A
VRYVKPHGALYNQACREEDVAVGVIDAAAVFGLPVVGLPTGWLLAEATDRVPYIPEGFADRRYRPDGALVPRSSPDAFVEDPEEAVRQADRLLTQHGVRTLCVHGDNPQAVEFVRRLRAALLRLGHVIRAFA